MQHRRVMERDAAWFEARAVEALFVRGLGRPLEPRLARRLRECGVDLSRPLLPAYPRATIEGALEVVAEELSPGTEPGAAHRRLGERLVRGFLTSLKARALVAAARAYGPERTVARAVGRHPTPTNFLEVRLVRQGPGSYQALLTWQPPHPALLEGMAAGLLVALGAKGVGVEALPEATHATRLSLRFEP